jgi:hypothetical protein
MARPQVTDRGGGLQIWRVAMNILNKQSRTADRRWPSIIFVSKYVQGPWKWTDSLALPKHRKSDVRFGTWNVRSLYRTGSFKTVAMELGK